MIKTSLKNGRKEVLTSVTALNKQQIKDVIDGKAVPDRIPMVYQVWIAPESFGENTALAYDYYFKFPYDIDRVFVNMPAVYDAPVDAPDYCFVHKKPERIDQNIGLDAHVAICDWAELDEIIEKFPSAEYHNLFPETQKTEKYRIIHWWNWLFERLWSLRGMENALTDFYTNPDELHRLFLKLTDFYCRILERAKTELNADGLFLSDDIGTQKAPFFSLDIFNEFIKPYYKRLIDKAHSLDMHIWLHTCGNIEMYLPGLIEIGLDVIHPIQKYTMNEADIMRKFGGQICFLAGFDVQQTIPNGSPEEVRTEVRYMIDTYFRKDGRLILTLGNGTSDCPIENFYALMDETYRYGKQKVENICGANTYD